MRLGFAKFRIQLLGRETIVLCPERACLFQLLLFPSVSSISFYLGRLRAATWSVFSSRPALSASRSDNHNLNFTRARTPQRYGESTWRFSAKNPPTDGENNFNLPQKYQHPPTQLLAELRTKLRKRVDTDSSEKTFSDSDKVKDRESFLQISSDNRVWSGHR